MSTIREIYDIIDSQAPFETAESWDNSGFLVETESTEAKKVLLALDITAKVVLEAVQLGANLIISHHPVMFDPIKRVGANDIVYQLIKHQISAICAHTNLDLARGGVNDALAKRLGLKDIGPLAQPDKTFLSLGRIGELPKPYEPDEFAELVKTSLGCPMLRYTGSTRQIERVAVCGGSGGELLYRAAEIGAHALVTADVKHNLMLEAPELGVMLLDAGHYRTEAVVLPQLMKLLHASLPKVEVAISKCESDPARCI